MERSPAHAQVPGGLGDGQCALVLSLVFGSHLHFLSIGVYYQLDIVGIKWRWFCIYFKKREVMINSEVRDT